MAHILLIEPDKLIAGQISDYFANAKHTLAVHSDPQQAVTSADKKRPQAVILELQLAGRSGVEFLYEFRSYPDWQDIPIIIFTNLPAGDVAGFAGSLQELNISAVLRKSQSSLRELLESAERSIVYETA